MSSTREIRKYPNRRLYDVLESRYITLQDLRELVVRRADFVVIEKRTRRDITSTVLLQALCEMHQEGEGQEVLSTDFMMERIRELNALPRKTDASASVASFNRGEERESPRLNALGSDYGTD